MQTNKDYARALGVQWGVSGRVDPALGNTTNLAFPNNGSIGGRTGAVQGPTGQPTARQPAAQRRDQRASAWRSDRSTAPSTSMSRCSALERSGNGRMLSTPRVSTQNNVEAEVKQGIQIPIQTVSNNTVTVTFKDAALTLKVTPQITAAGTVIMKIALENATADFSKRRSTAFRRSTPSAPPPPCWSATARRRSSAASTPARRRRRPIARRA